MSIYHALFFNNGRVAFVEWKDIEDAISQGKELLVVCNAWSGGYAHAIGAHKRKGYEDWEPEYVYDMYGYDVEDIEFNTTDLQKFYKVIFIHGEMIYMQSGDQATYYGGGQFIDNDTSYHKFKQSYKYNGETIEKFENLRRTVDQERTQRSINDKEKIKCLSGFAVFTY